MLPPGPGYPIRSQHTSHKIFQYVTGQLGQPSSRAAASLKLIKENPFPFEKTGTGTGN